MQQTTIPHDLSLLFPVGPCMYIPRNITLIIHYILDQWLPPIIRDSRLCMYPFFRFLFGNRARAFMEFKDRVPSLDALETKKIYEQTASAHIQRQTDLNPACVHTIKQRILGSSVLDIACGRGYLSGRLSRRYRIVGADMYVGSQAVHTYPDVSFVQVDITDLPFEHQAFDTVVCAHTLEHVPDIHSAVQELKRVTKKRLLLVVPRQRPYRYTFDLHVHFFPYAWSLELLMKREGSTGRCELVGGDWLYVEESQERAIAGK